MEELKTLVNRLIKYSSEEEWFEFKENWYDAGGIGEYEEMNNLQFLLQQKLLVSLRAANLKLQNIMRITTENQTRRKF